uniref:uncharacterized protein LOC120811018 isoform X1 n=2 Tax=Gasterosteus aculeatus aculeatus TaxID=481459 RepID=UPI001A99FB61|nr:uncharacterized protein LOC120811018 isoform X1 [Gasterosteus aculeatus aculeatus]
MAHFYLRGLLVLLIIISERTAETLTASKEEDVLLSCFDSNVMDPSGRDRFKLIKYATNSSSMEVILARPTTTNHADAKRVTLEVNGTKVCVFLKKIQPSDEGLYGCEICKGWDCTLKNVSLKVKDCKTLPAVKANASAPVNLSCPVDNTDPKIYPQNISWFKVKSGNPVSLNSEGVEMNGTSLAFLSVQPSDSGWFGCKYVLGQTQRCYEFNLRVQDKKEVVATAVPGLEISESVRQTKMETETVTETERNSVAFLPVVVTSVIIGTAIMAALIGLFVYCSRNTQRVTQQTLRHTPPGTLMHAYEVVNVTPTEDGACQDNSLCQQFVDESLCTFRY